MTRETLLRPVKWFLTRIATGVLGAVASVIVCTLICMGAPFWLFLIDPNAAASVFAAFAALGFIGGILAD